MIISFNTTNYSSPLKPGFKASLLTQLSQKYTQQPQQASSPIKETLPSNAAQIPVSTPIAEKYNNQYGTNSLLSVLMNKTQPMTPAASTTPVQTANTEPLAGYKNNLRSMFQNNQAVIYAMVPRTFNAQDTDGNGLIEGNEEPGYFTNMVERLDELKSYGVNTLHDILF